MIRSIIFADKRSSSGSTIGGRMMRALQVTRHGAPGEVLEVRDVDVPEPGEGEVRIRVAAAALNFNDIARCRGTLVSVSKEPPFTLGMDVCGVVDAAGAGAEHLIGRRVVAISKDALDGIAEYTVAPAAAVFDAPPELSDDEAAAFLIPFHTTHLALFRRGHLVEGETLLVHSGASGLGTAAIQLGAAAGARVIATVSSAEKAALCRSLGADGGHRPHPGGLRRRGVRRDRRGRRARGVRPGRR